MSKKELLQEIRKHKKDFNSIDIQEMLKEGRKLVSKFDEAYRKDDALITDSEFDELYMALEKVEKEHPEFLDPESPTQQVQDVIIGELKKVTHNSFMGSQDKVKTKEEILKFLNTINDLY